MNPALRTYIAIKPGGGLAIATGDGAVHDVDTPEAEAAIDAYVCAVLAPSRLRRILAGLRRVTGVSR